MKNLHVLIVTLFLLQCPSLLRAQYPAQNISLYAQWSDPAVPAETAYNAKYNSVWGYYDSIRKKEYAIIGATTGTYFIDITNPAVPVVKDFVAGRNKSCLWREYKTYGHYLYMVSDNPPPNSLQIFDLSTLPDSVRVVHDSDSILSRAHTLFIDGKNLYCASVKGSFGDSKLMVFSLENPELPALVRRLEQDFPNVNGPVHDLLVRNDTMYVSWGYSGLYIIKYNGNQPFKLLGSLTQYPSNGYNHSSALTPDGKTLVFADEVPAGLPMKTIDISDLGNIEVLETFKSNAGATPHNPYMYGKDKVVIAYYQDGLQIFDISDPKKAVRTGYFDTDPQEGFPNSYTKPDYSGCWGAYVLLPSGRLLASDMQRGLFILNADIALNIDNKDKGNNSAHAFPNPFNNDLYLSVHSDIPDQLDYHVIDITGRKVMEGRESITAGRSDLHLSTPTLNAGVYLLKLQGKKFSHTQKIIRR